MERSADSMPNENAIDSPTPELDHSSFRRTFSLDEANAALPLVSRIARDVVELSARVREAQKDHRQCSDADDAQGAEAAQNEFTKVTTELNECLSELDNVGCLLKDYDRGLIDFPSVRDDRIVFLCWQLGEDTVEHWHETDAGFGGRQAIE